jgi:hypothetical protein
VTENSQIPPPTKGVPMPATGFLRDLRGRLISVVVSFAKHASRLFHLYPPSGGF